MIDQCIHGKKTEKRVIVNMASRMVGGSKRHPYGVYKEETEDQKRKRRVMVVSGEWR